MITNRSFFILLFIAARRNSTELFHVFFGGERSFFGAYQICRTKNTLEPTKPPTTTINDDDDDENDENDDDNKNLSTCLSVCLCGV